MEGHAWMDGNTRVGDYILLIDSDTRVPEDCRLDSVSEMEQSPEVGILQFSSGVSLTVYDELARWEKYAYGCNELLFHPIYKWPTMGPFTPLFRKFLCSGVPTTSKITVVSYIGTYYAIAAAWIMTSTNYFLYGWFSDYLDRYYVDSWQVWFSIIIVFNGLGNISLVAMRYRGHKMSFFGCLLENFKWMVLLAIFLGGLSLHVLQAILSHMFEIEMTWGVTSKEAEFSNFWIEVPRVIKKVCDCLGQPNDTFRPRPSPRLILSSTPDKADLDIRVADMFLTTVPLLDDLLSYCDHHHEYHGRCTFRALQLADYRLRRHLSHVDSDSYGDHRSPSFMSHSSRSQSKASDE